MDVKALSLQLVTLKGSFDAANEAATLKAMKVLMPQLKDSDNTCEKFVK